MPTDMFTESHSLPNYVIPLKLLVTLLVAQT